MTQIEKEIFLLNELKENGFIWVDIEGGQLHKITAYDKEVIAGIIETLSEKRMIKDFD